MATTAQAAITWDGGGGNNSWFDYHNWTEDGAMLIPPGQDADNLPETTADVTSGEANIVNTAGLTDGAVIYDPSANDPFYTAAGSLFFPTGFDRQTIWRMFLSNNDAADPSPTDSKLIIKGNLSFARDVSAADSRWLIGRTSGTAGTPITGTVIQEKGVVMNNFGDVDLGANQTTIPLSYGNGTYDYRSGTLEQGMTAGRLRLSAGGSVAVGGVGKFIMHNPGTETNNGGGGYVRAKELLVAAFSGQNGLEPNGTTQGVGLVEFHYENGNTRPFQVVNNLTLANGGDATAADTGVRSSRLRLVLDAAPTINGSGVPQDLGLFDVNSDNDAVGNIIAPGGGVSDFGITFSNADAPDPLAPSAVYDNLVDTITTAGADNIVTAMFHSSTYRWRIYYNGNINWSDIGNSVLDLTKGDGDGIEGPGTGKDIVLIGLDSIVVPEGLPGDYNGDLVVNAADYTVWRNNLGAASEASLNGNGDGSGTVDAGDYDRWKLHFGETSGPGAGGLSASAAPEPTSVLLTMIGFVGLAGIRRRGA